MTDKLPPIPQNLDPMVRAAIQSWNDWRLRGAPDREPYWRNYGLCTAVGVYFRLNGWTFGGGCNLCAALFKYPYPFGRVNYHERRALNTQHLDPARIAWVEATLAANPVGEEQ